MDDPLDCPMLICLVFQVSHFICKNKACRKTHVQNCGTIYWVLWSGPSCLRVCRSFASILIPCLVIRFEKTKTINKINKDLLFFYDCNLKISCWHFLSLVKWLATNIITKSTTYLKSLNPNSLLSSKIKLEIRILSE